MLLPLDSLILHDLGGVAGEIGLVDVLDFSFGVLPGNGFNHSMLGAVGCFQETEEHRSVLETPEMPVLCFSLYGHFGVFLHILWRICDAVCYVDYLVVVLFKHYNHVGSHL